MRKTNNSPTDSNYENILYNGFQYSVEQFDKAIIYISSGALALSITFIEKIVPLKLAIGKGFLVSSWFFEIFTIMLFTLNHFLSFRAFNKRIEDLYNEKEPSNKKDETVKRINVLMMFTLLMGLSFCIIFISKNI